MATCNQTNEPLGPFTKKLFDSLTRNMYDTVDCPMPICNPRQRTNYKVEFIDGKKLKIDGIPRVLYLNRKIIIPIFSWEKMMELYNQGQTTFTIEGYG